MKGFKKEIYQNIDINKLILYGLFSLLNKKEKCIFENILQECFLLFPEAFSFSLILKWPDARKIDRPLRSLRQKGIIKKDSNNCFSLSKQGEKEVQELVKIFKQGQLRF
ncbi:MAG: hypothetical protein PHN37_01135 [Candidatus Pacebacteria bacterium]|nr:hypothetical protein [Candidatus Paceibacterota bacterium]